MLTGSSFVQRLHIQRGMCPMCVSRHGGPPELRSIEIGVATMTAAQSPHRRWGMMFVSTMAFRKNTTSYSASAKRVTVPPLNVRLRR